MPSSATGQRPRTVAVMQPYFFPYAGYFRLLAQAEVFVLFDCVQHRARGRVHRTEVPAPAGGLEWLTLPLASAARDTRIQDLRFADQADALWAERLARHAGWAQARGEAAEAVRTMLDAGRLPPPFVDDARCKECSLIDLCQPQALGALRQHARAELFDPER